MLTVEPTNAYNKAYTAYPKIKYNIVIIAKNGVNVEKSIKPSNIPSSKNNVFDIIAVAIITIICNNPTIPIPIVFPNTIVFGVVDVTSVSIIFDVFSVVIADET